MDLWDAIRECQFTGSLVKAEGISEFVYPMSGSVISGIRQTVTRSRGALTNFTQPRLIPPLTNGELDALQHALEPHQRAESLASVECLLAAYGWISASLVNDDSQVYQMVKETLDGRMRELGNEFKRLYHG